MSLKTRILKVLLWAATVSSPAMAQQAEKHSETDGKYFKTEIDFPQEIDGQEVYLAGLVTFAVGLDQQTLDLVSKDNKDNSFTFVSDNGLVKFTGNRAIGVVVKNGNVSYVSSVNRCDFHSLTDEYLIDVVNKFVKLYTKENSTLYEVLVRNKQQNKAENNSDQANTNAEKEELVRLVKSKAGLDDKAFSVVDKSSKPNMIKLVSDNGFVVLMGKQAMAAVVKDGRLSYAYSANVESGGFRSTTDTEDIEMLQRFVMFDCPKNSTIYKAVSQQQANAQTQQKKPAQNGVWHTANNRVGKIKYKFENGRFLIDEGSTFEPIRLPRPEIKISDDGYYFIGDGMCKSISMSSVWPSYWAHMHSVWVHYGVILDLKEREKNEVLSVEEYKFIQRFEKTIKQYGLALDANNSVVLLEQVLEKGDMQNLQDKSR